MRFAFICLDFLHPKPSSIGLTTAILAAELVGRGHDVVVVALDDRRRERFVNGRGIQMLPVRQRGAGRLAEIGLRRRIRRVLLAEAERFGLDGVEVPDFLGLLPFGLENVPVQARLHNSVTSLCRFRGAREGWLMRTFERATLAKAERWVGASEFAFGRTREIFGMEPGQRWMVPCPVDVGDGSAREKSGDPSVVFCGPLNWLKGGDLFVEMAGLARKRGIAATFEVLGDDPEGLGWRSDGLVHCLGRMTHGQVLERMARATAVVSPSRMEFQGIAVMEAMARGVPAILPKRQPFTEYFSDREACLVEGEGPERWVEPLARLLAGDGSAAELGAAGQRAVRERFSVARVADRWLEGWRQVERVESGRRGGG